MELFLLSINYLLVSLLAAVLTVFFFRQRRLEGIATLVCCLAALGCLIAVRNSGRSAERSSILVKALREVIDAQIQSNIAVEAACARSGNAVPMVEAKLVSARADLTEATHALEMESSGDAH